MTFTASKNKTSLDLSVSGVKTEDLKSTVADFTGVVTFNDTIAPAATKSEFNASGDVVITFSEPLKANANPLVRVNNTPVVANAVAEGATTVTVPAAALTTAGISVSAGSSATVYVAGLTDTVGNEMELYNATVTKVNDTTKPAVTSVTQVGQNQVKVVLNKAIVAANGSNNFDLEIGDFKFLKGTTVYDSTGVTLDTSDNTNKTYLVDFTESEIYGAAPNAVETQTVTLLLAKDAVKDAYSNGNDAYSNAFTFSTDKTAPAFVSSKVSTNKQTFELTFGEALDAATDKTKIIVTDASGVRYVVDSATRKGATGADAKTLVVDLTAAATAIANGTYTIQVQKGAVQDARTNSPSAFTTTVVVGDSVDTAKPVVTLDATSGENKFVLNFDKEVTSTALSLANYSLDGKALPTGTVIYFNNTNKNSVTIELPENSVNIGAVGTGTNAVLKATNVADKSGNIVNPTNLTVKVSDNTAATIKSVQVIGQEVYVTFSEALTIPGGATDADTIFTIKNGTSAVTATNIAAVAGNSAQVKFTLDALPTSTVTVTVIDGQVALKDANLVNVK